MLTRLQPKSKPRNGAREIFVVARVETSRALRLCRELDSRARQEHAQNGDKIDAAQRSKTTTLSMAQTLAGRAGLEPGLWTGHLFENPKKFSGLAAREGSATFLCESTVSREKRSLALITSFPSALRPAYE